MWPARQGGPAFPVQSDRCADTVVVSRFSSRAPAAGVVGHSTAERFVVLAQQQFNNAGSPSPQPQPGQTASGAVRLSSRPNRVPSTSMAEEFDISDSAAPPASLVPQPPTGAPESRYNARLNRARSSNREMRRSTSAASLMEDDEEGRTTGNPGAPIGLRPKGLAAPWSRSVAAAMEAEVERADCAVMVRDITHAVLPTRASFQGRGAVPVQNRPSAIGEDDEQQPDWATETTAPPLRSLRLAQPAGGELQKPGATYGGGSTVPTRIAESESNEEQSEHGDEDHEAAALAMQAAITSNRADMVETLLDGDVGSGGRVDPDCFVGGGKRPLGLAASAGLYNIAATLLSHGANAALADRNGDTPLHLAVMRNHVALARLLLDAGAKTSAKDGCGRTALHLSQGLPMQQLLRAADAGDALPPRLPGEEEDDDEEDDSAGAQSKPNVVDASVRAVDGGGGVLAPAPPNGATAPVARSGKKGESESVVTETTAAAAPPAAAAAAAAAPYGPPPVPAQSLGDAAVTPDKLPRAALIRELQSLLNSTETDLKRLLVLPCGLLREVQCDVVRVGTSNTYRCYLRLGARNDRRVCIFEASRTRKGKLKNSQYRILLPAADARMVPSEFGPAKDLPSDALTGDDGPLYCGKVRSYNLSGSNFVAYDDGVKPEDAPRGRAVRFRRQMVAMCFNKSTSRRVPMTMRMLLPTPNPSADAQAPSGAAADLLESLQNVPFEAGQEQPPSGTQLLKLVPPRWNADEQMFQLFCEGRACCMSNKNVQLADTSRPDEAALQVGKLRSNMFNVDMSGCVSPFQAFAAALAVFDQSSVRRRF